MFLCVNTNQEFLVVFFCPVSVCVECICFSLKKKGLKYILESGMVFVNFTMRVHYYEEIARICLFGFCQSAEISFHNLLWMEPKISL